jgi:hypothetical protein
MNVTHRGSGRGCAGDLRKRATATSWGSSGRRFKSRQPDREKPCLSCNDVLSVESHYVELGTILGPQVLRQQLSSTRNRLAVRMQVPLCRAEVSVARDLAEGVQRYSGVSHPR